MRGCGPPAPDLEPNRHKSWPRQRPTCDGPSGRTCNGSCGVDREERVAEIARLGPEIADSGVGSRRSSAPPSASNSRYLVSGKPRLTLLVAGSGQRLVITLPRV